MRLRFSFNQMDDRSGNMHEDERNNHPVENDPTLTEGQTKVIRQFTIPTVNIESESDSEDIITYEPLLKRKIQICCTDEKQILSFYWTKMSKSNDEVLLVHVIDDTKTKMELNNEREEITSVVGEFMNECTLKGIQCQQTFPIGKPAEAVCEVASQFKPHLIVIGSIPTKKFQRNVNKSVSRYILQNSKSPVLMVPLLRGSVHKGFTTVAAVAQAALRFGFSDESPL